MFSKELNKKLDKYHLLNHYLYKAWNEGHRKTFQSVHRYAKENSIKLDVVLRNTFDHVDNIEQQRKYFFEAAQTMELNFFSSRNDEIGDLSRSLDRMTKDLWKRMDAIAAFAASSITKADPIKTGLAAVRVGITMFVVPFVFVFYPELLLIEDAFISDILTRDFIESRPNGFEISIFLENLFLKPLLGNLL